LAILRVRHPGWGRDVQHWFDALLDDERDEAKDTLVYLQVQPRHLWNKPEFEAFDADISEVRFKVLKKVFRIYGAFWPEGRRLSYTFLLGKNKKRSNDQDGKREAEKRLKRLRSGEANVHEFEFEKESGGAPSKREAGPRSIR
jgi:hypothetical protein